jgi:predicted branched-subunit amino acid permease
MAATVIHQPSGPTVAAFGPYLPWRQVRAGMAAMAPLVIGYAPFALMLGGEIAGHPSPAAGLAGTWLIYGGSAHVVVLQLLEGGAAPALAVAAGLFVNARLVVYGMSMAPHWRQESGRFRLVAAALLVDPSWALAQDRRGRPGSADDHRAHYVGASLALVAGWSLAIVVGMLAGGRLAQGLALELALPLCLLALLIPRLQSRAGRVAAITGAVTAVLGSVLPPGVGLMAAIVAGTAAGALVDRRSS